MLILLSIQQQMFTIKCTNIINTIMTNTIRHINSKTVMLTRNGKTFMLIEIKNPKTVDVYYKIKNKYYA